MDNYVDLYELERRIKKLSCQIKNQNISCSTSNDLPIFSCLYVNQSSSQASWGRGISINANINAGNSLNPSLIREYSISKIDFISVQDNTIITENLPSPIVVITALQNSTEFILNTQNVILAETQIVSILNAKGHTGVTVTIKLTADKQNLIYSLSGLKDPVINDKVKIYLNTSNSTISEGSVEQTYTDSNVGNTIKIYWDGEKYTDGTLYFASIKDVLVKYPTAKIKCETVTQFIDNNNGTFSYINEEGVVKTFDILGILENIENNRQIFSTQQDALNTIGPNKTFYWSENNIEGVNSPNNGVTGRT